MVIDSPSFLNKAMIFFLILSSTGPLLLLIAASPSSLYSPTFSFPIKFDNLSRRYKPTSSQISNPSKLPIVTSNNVSFPFLTQAKDELNGNIIWFNPPYSQNAKTNIGKAFLKLVKKHFPRGHKLYKIFTRNTLKLSYSCISSMFNVIKQHIYKVLSTTEHVDRLCNCKNKENCPLDGKCLQTCIVYKADVITNKDSHIYYGASDGEPHKFISPSTSRTRHRTFKVHLETTRQRYQLQRKMEYRSLCLNIQMRVKKVRPMLNGEVRDSKS